jgi:hypothetical protein
MGNNWYEKLWVIEIQANSQFWEIRNIRKSKLKKFGKFTLGKINFSFFPIFSKSKSKKFSQYIISFFFKFAFLKFPVLQKKSNIYNLI